MKKVLKKMRYMKINDLLSPVIFICVLPFSFVFRIINKIKKRRLWLICEDGTTARDNGYHFFKYIREKHPDDYCFYVISKKASDYNKIKEYGNVIEFKSVKHWLFYLSAEYNISIHKHGNPCRSFFYFIHVICKLYNNRVFLQHGVTKDDMPFAYYKNARFRYFICSAQREFEFIRDTFGYPKGYVINTGLTRFDNLHDININKKQILIMPTWRNWFGGKTEFDNNIELFKKTEYFKNWNSFITDKEFNDFIKKQNLTVYFYPHQHMQKFLELFKTNNDNIKIVDNSIIDIQTLLKESALLITDYSSVFMDFAYMQKPTLYFQFDEDEFRKNHLQKGYFDYREDGFGPVVTQKNDVVKEFKKIYINGTDKKYKQRMDDFFEIRDNQNSKRLYDILKNKK